MIRCPPVFGGHFMHQSTPLQKVCRNSRLQMKHLRSPYWQFHAASAVMFALGAAIFSCPLETPDIMWAAPVSLGIVVLIYNFSRFNYSSGRDDRHSH